MYLFSWFINYKLLFFLKITLMLQKIKNDLKQKTEMEIEDPLSIITWYAINHTNFIIDTD